MANRSAASAVRSPAKLRCAIYTRKSSEEGLEQDFNSLDAQREACEAFIASQKREGWSLVGEMYDDGGFSGATMERPAFRRLLKDVNAGRIDVVVVYKVDRLTRSLSDFAKIVEIFDQHGVSFVSVTQQFNTTSSMGRLTLNILLSFAQFEREVTRSRPPRRRACGWAACRHSAMTSKTGNSSSTKRKPRRSDTFFGVTSNSSQSAN
jgi:site-specific DNA recombinase